jgi:hypothetical protein
MLQPPTVGHPKKSRQLLPLLSGVLIVAVLAGALLFSLTAKSGVHAASATKPAVAASTSDRGPSAAADAFNNQYVFWKGTDSNLWEAYYNSYTGKWNGPI